MNRAQKLLVSIQRELGGDVVRLCDTKDEKIEVISTGFDGLNRALGIGGYPRGRIVEIFGPESSGKSTLVLHALREAQGEDGLAALIDADRAFDAKFAKSIGVALDRLLVSRPEHAEQALDLVEVLARSGAVAMIAIDSVPALAPQVETEAQMSDDLDGQQARLMSRALRRQAAGRRSSNGDGAALRQPAPPCRRGHLWQPGSHHRGQRPQALRQPASGSAPRRAAQGGRGECRRKDARQDRQEQAGGALPRGRAGAALARDGSGGVASVGPTTPIFPSRSRGA